MSVEEALEFVDNLVFLQTGERLDKTQRIILRHLWEDEKQTYQDIANNRGYTEAHLKSVGAGLWLLLSGVLGAKVSKANFKGVVGGFFKTQQVAKLNYSHTSDKAAISISVAQVLHISDLHFGTTDNARTWYAQLAEDLRYELGCSRLDALIISGDIASKSTPDEYAAAQLFINFLSQEFHLESQKIVIVPGNHDVNWQLAEAAYSRINTEYSQEGIEEYLTDENGEFIEGLDKEQYKRRFINFSGFYEAIKGELYPLEYNQQYSLQHLPEQSLLILGLNSAWQIDHRRNKYRASINSEALSNALSLIRRNLAYKDCLKIAVWHHSLNSIFGDRITDSGVMEQLAAAGFRLILHGGVHRNENNSYRYEYSTSGQQINIIGAGVFGASLQESGSGYPWEYNFLKIEASKVTIETRRREDPNGVWKPDLRWVQGTELNPLPRYVIPLTLDDADDPKIYVELGKANAESGRFEEAIASYDKAIEIKPDFYEAWLYRGEALANLGRIEETIHNYEQALVITQEIGDRFGEGNSLIGLGNAYGFLEEYQRAIEFHQQSLDIFREIGDRSSEAICLSNLGTAYHSLGDYSMAIACHEQSLAIAHKIKDLNGESQSLSNLGLAYYSLGNYTKTIDYYQQSLQIFREIGDRSSEATSLSNLGNAYHSLGEYEQAIQYYQMSLTIAREIGDRYSEMTSLSNLGGAYSEATQGDKAENIESAIAVYTSVLAVCDRESFPEQWAKTQNNLGLAFSQRIKGDKAENIKLAIAAYKLALQVYTREAFPYEWAMTQNNLAAAYSKRIRGERADNLEQAIAACQQALQVYTHEAFPLDWATTQNNLAVAYRERIRGKRADNLEQAIAACEAALTVRTREALPFEWARTQMNLGTAYSERILGERSENLELAIACYQAALEVYAREAFPNEWAKTQNNLGLAFSERITGDKAENLQTAIACYQAALEVYTREAFPYKWADTCMNIGNAYEKIHDDSLNNIDCLNNIEYAVLFYQDALEIYTPEQFPDECLIVREKLSNAHYLLEHYQRELEIASSPRPIIRNEETARIEFVMGNLLDLEVDALVNPTGLDVSFGGEISSQIVQRLGSELYEILRNQPPLRSGEVFLTDAGSLLAYYIIHTPTEENSGWHTTASIVRGISAALTKANSLRDVETIAFPSIGTGAAGFHPTDLAPKVLKAVTHHFKQGTLLKKVIFAFVDETAYQAYASAYQMLLLETGVSYNVSVTIPQETVSLGEEIEISVNLNQAEIAQRETYTIQISHNDAIGGELNIILTAPGFQFNSDNTTSLPIDPDTANITQSATFNLTALRPGTTKIKAEIYCGETYKTTLETEVEVTAFEETELRPLIAARSRPVPQPDIILQVRTTWNADISACIFNYHIDSYQQRLLFADDVDYNSQSLSATWVERSHSLLKATLEEAASSLREDFRSRLVSLGQYLFYSLLPQELQNTFRTIASFNQPFTLLILADQDAWFPWELLHDGQKFLGDRFIIGRWLWELEKSRPYEFPVGAVNVAHYASVEQPELTLRNPSTIYVFY